MLSFAGVFAAFNATGVGEGSGWAGIIERARLADFRVVRAEAATANAKLFRDKPATHARAQVLTAIFLKCLGIIPSSGISWTAVTRLLEMPGDIQSADRTTRQFSLLSKKRTKGFVQGLAVAESHGQKLLLLLFWSAGLCGCCS